MKFNTEMFSSKNQSKCPNHNGFYLILIKPRVESLKNELFLF